MNSLRFLLVHTDAQKTESISTVLASANHTVLPTTGLDEAGEALYVERFDAVLLGCPFPALSLGEFTASCAKWSKASAVPDAFQFLRLTVRRPAGPECDGYLNEPLDPSALTEAVTRLGQALSQPADVKRWAEADGLPMLEQDKFEEQVGYDKELMVEIIDLFLEERQHQVLEMRDCVSRNDWEQLFRVAHTIKGSLGSLHATRARSHAQDLELAARDLKGEICGKFFAALEKDLEDLEPQLLSLRDEARS